MKRPRWADGTQKLILIWRLAWCLQKTYVQIWPVISFSQSLLYSYACSRYFLMVPFSWTAFFFFIIQACFKPCSEDGLPTSLRTYMALDILFTKCYFRLKASIANVQWHEVPEVWGKYALESLTRKAKNLQSAWQS